MSLQCRICFDDDIIDNLCSPCNCNGTSKYIHPECLTKWRNENINTPYYNKCIDCRTNYKYSIKNKEKLFLNNNSILYLNVFSIVILTLFLSSFDDENSFKIFNSIKNKNISQDFNNFDGNYFFIFYYIILSNYLVNCAFFILSFLFLFKVVNVKKYLLEMAHLKTYNLLKVSYIFVLYVLLSIKTFLSTCFLLVFLDCASVNIYIQKHNEFLHNININNIVYYVETNSLESTTHENLELSSESEIQSDNELQDYNCEERLIK